MGTYWDSFIETYSRRILSKTFSMKTILEAFWYYSQETEEYKMMADNIMYTESNQGDA